MRLCLRFPIPTMLTCYACHYHYARTVQQPTPVLLWFVVLRGFVQISRLPRFVIGKYFLSYFSSTIRSKCFADAMSRRNAGRNVGHNVGHNVGRNVGRNAVRRDVDRLEEVYLLIRRKNLTIFKTAREDEGVVHLKRAIFSILKVLPKDQRLYCNGEIMEDSRSLLSYGLTPATAMCQDPAPIGLALRNSNDEFEELEITPYIQLSDREVMAAVISE